MKRAVHALSKCLLLFSLTGLEGERPARLTRGEADRDTYRRSAVPRESAAQVELTLCAASLFGRIVSGIELVLRREGENWTAGGAQTSTRQNLSVSAHGYD